MLSMPTIILQIPPLIMIPTLEVDIFRQHNELSTCIHCDDPQVNQHDIEFEENNGSDSLLESQHTNYYGCYENFTDLNSIISQVTLICGLAQLSLIEVLFLDSRKIVSSHNFS
jgi:hypothetical protein